MEELRPGLWTWTARHPDWKPEHGGSDGWGPDVRSYAWAAGSEVALFDPILPAPGLDELLADRGVVVLLTCSWHARSARELVTGRGATAYAPESGADDPDVPVTLYRPGEPLPLGVEPRVAVYPGEAVLWIPELRALVAGDCLTADEDRIRTPPDSWIPEGSTREQFHAALRPLLEVPVELFLPTHGDPVTKDAHDRLERALA